MIFDGDVEKAIAIYTDRSHGENRVDMDLDEKPHGLQVLGTGPRMKYLKLEGKQTPVYRLEEKMVLLLTNVYRVWAQYHAGSHHQSV